MNQDRLKHLPTALRRAGHDGPTCGVKCHDHGSSAFRDEVLVLCGCGEELAIDWRGLVNAESCYCGKEADVLCGPCWLYYARKNSEGSCLGHNLCGRRDKHLGPCMAQVVEGARDDRSLRVVLCEPPVPEFIGPRLTLDGLFLHLANKIIALARKTKEAGPSAVATAPAARPRLTICCQGDWE